MWKCNFCLGWVKVNRIQELRGFLGWMGAFQRLSWLCAPRAASAAGLEGFKPATRDFHARLSPMRALPGLVLAAVFYMAVAAANASAQSNTQQNQGQTPAENQNPAPVKNQPSDDIPD